MTTTEKQTIKKSININAPKEKVWDVLLQDETYRIWTSAFHEGSYAEGGWDEGNKVYFKGPDGDGMVSMIKLHKPNEIITIEHLGMLTKGVEDFQSEMALQWEGALETYTVEEKGGITQLNISTDSTPEFVQYFEEAWDKALQKVKELAETANTTPTQVKTPNLTTKIFVNIAVKNLERSMNFFKNIGYTFNPQFTDETAACMIISDSIFAMLLTENKFREFTPTGREIADATKTTEVMIALSADNREAVDNLVNAAIANGAKEARPAQDYGFMYGRSFCDLDGHIWEVVWVDMSAMPQQG